MTVFIDTSAFYSMMDADDSNHANAKTQWTNLIQNDEDLICTNYVIIESFALIQRRLGLRALRVFQEDILPMVHVEWIGDEIHRQSTFFLFQSAKKSLSLVDCSSFAVMRKMGIQSVFAYDSDFKREGFDCLGQR